MDIISKIMGIIPPEKPPALISIFPSAAAQRIQAGKLPTIQVDKLILEDSEVCRFVDVAAMVTIKKSIAHPGQVVAIGSQKASRSILETQKLCQCRNLSTQKESST